MSPPSLAIDTRHVGDLTEVALRGSIDERFDLVQWGQDLASPLVIDLGGVELINSAGMSQWVHFLSEAVARGPVVLQRCSEPMVTLFSMVTDAVAGATVESLQAHYECDRCGREEVIELVVARDLAGRTPDGNAVMPERPCPRCDGLLRFAGHPERYLAFLKDE